MRRGFTLVELSIVLVIIGLLIGGILAAQSMISTAKINAVTMQIGQFDAGVENFKTKYNYLPGDAPSFGGNGDGEIALSCCNSYTALFIDDSRRFWNNFDPTQYKDGNINNDPATSSGPNKNVPLSKLGKAKSFFFASALGDNSGYTIPSPVTNYYAIMEQTVAQTPNAGSYQLYNGNVYAIKPVDLLALDTKIDDGNGISGNVLSGSILGGVNATSNSTCFSGNIYRLQYSTYECMPLIRIGASVGDLQ